MKISANIKVDKAMKAAGIPLQPNFYDCGVYLLGYIDKFLKSPREFVRKVLMREMDAEIDWPEMDASRMRCHIRDTLLAVHDTQERERLRGDAQASKNGHPGTKKVQPRSSTTPEAAAVSASEESPQTITTAALKSPPDDIEADRANSSIKPNLDLQEDSLGPVLKQRSDTSSSPLSSSVASNSPKNLQRNATYHKRWPSNTSRDDMLFEQNQLADEDKAILIKGDDQPTLVIPDSQPSTPELVTNTVTEKSSTSSKPQNPSHQDSSTKKMSSPLQGSTKRRHKPPPEIVNLDDDDDEADFQKHRTLRHSPRLKHQRTPLKATKIAYDDEIEEVSVLPRPSKYFSP
jgi:hypothetical protein